MSAYVLLRATRPQQVKKMDADASIAPPTRLAVTPDVAAEITGRTRTRIFEAIRKQELTARKDGKATVIETDELLRWLRSLPTRGRQLTMVECGGRDRWLP
jgi:hypothetical protein